MPLVLIADDDEDMRLSLEALVHSIGFDAAIFESAAALLAFARLHEARCVISDLRMPGISGLELVRHLAQTAPHIPVILVSAYVTETLVEQAATAGALCLLKKPITPSIIIAKLRDVMAHGD